MHAQCSGGILNIRLVITKLLIDLCTWCSYLPKIIVYTPVLDNIMWDVRYSYILCKYVIAHVYQSFVSADWSFVYPVLPILIMVPGFLRPYHQIKNHLSIIAKFPWLSGFRRRLCTRRLRGRVCINHITSRQLCDVLPSDPFKANCPTTKKNR